jgi:CheY-like chemotaxis protein
MVALEDACRQNRPYPIALVDVQMPHMDGFQLIREIRKHPEWNAARILLLSSANAPGFTAKAQGLGIAGFMLKPILPDELRRSLVRLCSGVVSDRLTGREARGAAPGTPVTPLRVLLAEDNPVSQALARRMLEKRGHQVITANDGAEAVARWQAEPIDVILMDGLMPGTDGFEATRQIRAAEPLPLTAGNAPGNPQVPIVAMTACALKGDREHCLDAGMDDYVAKPVTLDQLEAAMLRAKNARRRDVQTAPRV